MKLKIFLPFFLLLFFSSFQLFCVSPVHNETKDKPWLTGPLLTPTARIVPKGHFIIEPYIFRIVVNGRYDKDWRAFSTPKFYQYNPQIVCKIGLTEKINLSCVFQGYFNHTRGHSSTEFGDLPLGLDLEIYKGKTTFVKFTIQETIPTGNFQNLDPDELGVDLGGEGAFSTTFGFTFSKLVHFSGKHFLSSRFNISITLPAPYHVTGANLNGGDPSTEGKIRLGKTLSLLYGAEYTLTQNWALALDVFAQFSEEDHFEGRTRLPVGAPSSAMISAAPAIEYNWNEDVGVIVGSWFTIAGRNSSRFTSAVAALNYYY